MGTRAPKLFDLVAVLNAPSDVPVEVGDVGTIVELYDDAGEIEFLDHDGRTRCLTALKFDDLLILNRERTPVG